MIPRSIHIIKEVEDKFPVEEWKINGVYVWPIVRIELGFIIYQERIEANSSIKNNNSNSIFKRIVGSVKGVYELVVSVLNDKNSKKHFQETDIVFFSDGISYTKIRDTWFEKFCDSLILLFEKKEKKTFILDQLYNCYSPRYSQAKNIQPLIDYAILKSIVSKGNTISKLDGYEDFLIYIEDINKKYDVRIKLAEINKRVHKIEQLTLLFLSILKKIKPSFAFVVCYYSDINMAFIAACKRLNILTIDIQHGVQTGDHPAYGLWSKLPQEGYELLPNHFWCWGKTEFEELKKWENLSHSPIKGGNSFFNLWLNPNNEIVKLYDVEIEKIINNNKHVILLTLQFGIEKIELINSILSVIKQTQYRYNWWIRLHPSHTQELNKFEDHFRKIGIYKGQIKLPSSLPLYSILTKVKLHLTHSSSTVIEAAEMGIKSIISSEIGIELFKDIVGQKMAYGAFNEDKIKATLEQLVNQTSVPNHSLFFSDSQADETINNLLKSIVN